jgi:putative ABC transport system ATP-binding protein
MRQVWGWLAEIIGPDSRYFWLAMVYGVAISLLSLATPISVQLLINSVANTALPTPLFTLAGILFLLLALVGVLSAFRVHLMALFERRVFARVVAEITIRAVHAQNPFFADARRVDLFNRYFDLMTVQKSVPSLLIGGFTIILQSAVGLVVTSFYHPFFLAFNVLLVLLLLLVWQLWAPRAIPTAVGLSHAKHNAARWLESVGGSNGFYKSSRHLDFAMDRTEDVTAAYVARHRAHFRYSFAQTISFLFLYAAASAALLALGGWLIIGGQLSIGQLVAAELILSGVFYGISQLGTYLDDFYDLVASSEELSLLYGIPQEAIPETARERPESGLVRLRDVEHDGARFDFQLEPGVQLVTVAPDGADRVLGPLLKRHVAPTRGLVSVGGADLGALDMYLLRSEIMVLERPTIVEVSIREYLRLARPDVTAGEMLDVLGAVGLEERIARLPHGLDTALASSGWPLSIGEVMALKLANAALSRPRVLMLSQLYDLLSPDRVRPVLDMLRAAGTTVLLVTERPEAMMLDGYFLLRRDEQMRFATLADLKTRLRSTADA